MEKGQARQHALLVIEDERSYQDSRWPDPHDERHTPLEWAALIAAYVGKLAALSLGGVGSDARGWDGEERRMYRSRLAQIGALAVAALEMEYRERPET